LLSWLIIHLLLLLVSVCADFKTIGEGYSAEVPNNSAVLLNNSVALPNGSAAIPNDSAALPNGSAAPTCFRPGRFWAPFPDFDKVLELLAYSLGLSNQKQKLPFQLPPSILTTCRFIQEAVSILRLTSETWLECGIWATP